MLVKNSSVNMQFDHHSVRRQQLSPLAAGSGEPKPHEPQRPPKVTSHPSAPLAKQGKMPALAYGSNLSASFRKMKMVLEYMLGKHIQVASEQGRAPRPSELAADSLVAAKQQAISITETQSDALVYRLRSHESEKTSVNIQAVLNLRSGRTINLNLEQSMSRSLDLDLQLNALDAAKFIDPLALNFSGPVSLSEDRVEFDLDADGHMENIATFASNSAYLALDKNGDGKINDGSELFGALSGDGFAELAQYDEDGNGFIDAGDSVFSRLQLYNPGGALRSINSAGVEAIYTASVTSPFTLTSKSGETLGMVRSTGFHVGAYGANTAQQIDLAV